MQQKSNKNAYLISKIAETIQELRQKKNYSCRKLAYEFGISRRNLNKIENALIECKISTLMKICEALDIKFSDFAKLLEDKLGKDFTLIDV